MNRELKKRLTPPLVIRPRAYLIGLAVAIIILCLPWSMFSTGTGRITALNPNERLQEITAPVDGFVEKWYVREGMRVREGDPVFDLVDNDPAYLERLKTELQAAQSGVEEARLAHETAKINLDRQQKLYREGLSSRKEFEKAKIDVAKLAMDLAKATAVLVKSQTQVSRQTTQQVKAPRDGAILRVLHGEGNFLVKSGDVMVVFAPELKTVAVESWHLGNDLRFLQKGQSVRVQFEGWPAVQIPGWPSVAIGTFKGRVEIVDYASSYAGKFRVLTVPDEPWPSDRFLKLNATARAIISMGNTTVGTEIWRKLNDFPPSTEPMRDELNTLLEKKEKARPIKPPQEKFDAKKK